MGKELAFENEKDVVVAFSNQTSTFPRLVWMMIPAVPVLTRKGSSFRRTSIEDKKLLAENALKKEVIILPSGVQLQPLYVLQDSANKEVSQLNRKQYKLSPKNGVWKVKSFEQNGFITEEIITLDNASKGFKEAMLSGYLQPGTKWRLWISAELASPRAAQSLTVKDIEIVSIRKPQNYFLRIAIGFFTALLLSGLAWIGKIFNSRTKQANMIVRKKTTLPKDSERILLLRNEEHPRILIKFSVDSLHMGDAIITLFNYNKFSNWFLQMCKEGNLNGLAIVPGEENSHQLKIVFKRNMQFTNQVWPDQEEVIDEIPIDDEQSLLMSESYLNRYLLINIQYRIVFFTVERDVEGCLCIGRVIEGIDSIIALENLEDGGMIENCSVQS